MADENNDQQGTSLPPPMIDKSTFPGAGGATQPDDNQSSDDQQDQPQQEDSQLEVPINTDIQSVLGIDTDQSQSGEPVNPDVETPEIADDNDLIEKEWVNKAKNIIEKTKSNPHVQSDEMTLFKADYIKKRYNKTIKTSE